MRFCIAPRCVLASAIVASLSFALAASAETISSGTYQGANGPTSTTPGISYTGGAGYSYEDISYLVDTLTINGGSFIGGTGGTASVPGNFNRGGIGGPALDISGRGAYTRGAIHGGTFVGGDGGPGVNMGFGTAQGEGGSAILMGANLDGSVDLDIDGGTFTPGSGIPAGVAFRVGFGSTLNLYGDFPGAPFQITEGNGLLTGRLTNNSEIATYTYSVIGTINVIPVPEPTALAFLAVGALGFGRRRR